MGETGASGGEAVDKLFNGYDSIANGMLNQSAVSGDAGHGGGRSVVNIRVCETLSELAQALDIDGSLSVSYLKAVNVTAKMNFVKKLNATATSATSTFLSASSSIQASSSTASRCTSTTAALPSPGAAAGCATSGKCRADRWCSASPAARD
jgi:hypothetical protein